MIVSVWGQTLEKWGWDTCFRSNRGSGTSVRAINNKETAFLSSCSCITYSSITIYHWVSFSLNSSCIWAGSIDIMREITSSVVFTSILQMVQVVFAIRNVAVLPSVHLNWSRLFQMFWSWKVWKVLLRLFWDSNYEIIQETFHKISWRRNIDLMSWRRTPKLKEWVAPGQDREVLDIHQCHARWSRAVTRRWRRRSRPAPGWKDRSKDPGPVRIFFRKVKVSKSGRFPFWSSNCYIPGPTMFLPVEVTRIFGSKQFSQ